MRRGQGRQQLSFASARVTGHTNRFARLLMKSLRLLDVALPALLLFSGVATGQEYCGRILGRVVDPSGAVVPQGRRDGAEHATNVPAASLSNAQGNFLVLLEPGSYHVTVEAAGFKKKVVSSIAVRAGDQLVLDFPLDVGSASE